MVGTQPTLQTLGVVAPHVAPGAEHDPQCRMQPQPSPTTPQSKPFDAHVIAAGHVPHPLAPPCPPVEVPDDELDVPAPVAPVPVTLVLSSVDRLPHDAAATMHATKQASQAKVFRMART